MTMAMIMTRTLSQGYDLDHVHDHVHDHEHDHGMTLAMTMTMTMAKTMTTCDHNHDQMTIA
jgi:hypothetical protein